MKIYYFGSERLVRKFFEESILMQPLRIWHLHKLSSHDIIVTPRPWSILLEIMLFTGNHYRPLIVQVADGLCSPLNAGKTINRRYGSLQKYIMADIFIASQNRSDFSLLTQNIEYVISTDEIDCKLGRYDVDLSEVVLVSGNDPFFDFSIDRVVESFCNTVDRLRAIGTRKLLLSSPDKRLERRLLKKHPWIESIGKLKDYPRDLSNSLMLGSPSTVLFDHMRQGGLALLLNIYNDPVLLNYFVSDLILENAPVAQGMLSVTAPKIISSNTKKFCLDELHSALKRRAPNEFPRREFVKAVRFRLFLRELYLLFGGK